MEHTDVIVCRKPAIASQLAKQMNGSLIVSSDFGHGSTFSFEVSTKAM